MRFPCSFHIVVFVIWCAFHPAFGQDQPLSATILQNVRSRSLAPIPLVVELDWNGQGLKKGRLEMQFSERGVYEIRTSPFSRMKGVWFSNFPFG